MEWLLWDVNNTEELTQKFTMVRKNPTKYCPLEHCPCRAVQFPVSSGSPSNVFLVQTGCAKDAQLCSCSVTQAAFTESPFSNTLFGPNPAISAGHCPGHSGEVVVGSDRDCSGHEVGMSHGREAAPWSSGAEVRQLTLIVWSLIIWHLSKSPSALSWIWQTFGHCG